MNLYSNGIEGRHIQTEPDQAQAREMVGLSVRRFCSFLSALAGVA